MDYAAQFANVEMRVWRQQRVNGPGHQANRMLDRQIALRHFQAEANIPPPISRQHDHALRHNKQIRHRRSGIGRVNIDIGADESDHQAHETVTVKGAQNVPAIMRDRVKHVPRHQIGGVFSPIGLLQFDRLIVLRRAQQTSDFDIVHGLVLRVIPDADAAGKNRATG